MPKKKLWTITAVIIAIVIVIGLSRQIIDALLSGSRIDKDIEQVSKLQEKNRELKKQLSEVLDPNFTEEIARNKLNMARPNETVVIIQNEDIGKILSEYKKPDEPKLPNWYGWMRLFFK